jgi:hypothetical protein
VDFEYEVRVSNTDCAKNINLLVSAHTRDLHQAVIISKALTEFFKENFPILRENFNSEFRPDEICVEILIWRQKK